MALTERAHRRQDGFKIIQAADCQTQRAHQHVTLFGKIIFEHMTVVRGDLEEPLVEGRGGLICDGAHFFERFLYEFNLTGIHDFSF